MRPAGELRHVLVLGGTEEGYALAEALGTRVGLRVTSSLAGATSEPRLPAGMHRIGGFGGVVGLCDWLVAKRVDLVVDASHPFALRISMQARDAAMLAGCRHLRLERPGWRAVPGDRWQLVADLDAGLAALGERGSQRVFAALGARAIASLAASSTHFVARGIEPPAVVPENVTWVVGRGPFDVAAERALLLAQRVDALLCRNSGGEGARAKLDAARELGLPVVMIERPRVALADTVADVAGALAAVEALLTG